MEYDEFKPQTPDLSSRGRAKWIALIGCGGGLALVACIAIFIGAIFLIVFGAIRSSDVYAEALQIARDSAEVSAALGDSFEPGWFVTGSINISGNGGDADISIPLSGPNGKGNLHAVALRQDGNWEFSTLRLEVDDGTRINLLIGR